MPYLPSTEDREDEDDDNLLLESCQKDLRALKEACRSFCDDESEDEEEPARLGDSANYDDDDVLLLSIQKKFGASRPAQRVLDSPSFAEEDDEDILRAVQERFSMPLRKRANTVGLNKPVGKGARTSKNICSFEESTTNSYHNVSVADAPTFFDSNISSSPAQISEETGFWLSGRVDDTVGECHVSLSPAQAPHVSVSPAEHPLVILSPAQTPEQTGFRLPGQVEIFDDATEGLSDETVDGFVYENGLLENLSNDSHKQSIRSALNALKKNRLFQRVLSHKLELLKLKLEETRDLKKRVRMLLDFQHVAKRKYAFEEEYSTSDDENTKRQRFCAWPRMRAECSQWGRGRPPENADVVKFKAMQKKYCLTFEPKSWTKEERIELVKGVEQQVQESRIRSVMELYSASNNDTTFLDNQVKTFAEHPPTPEEIRKALPIMNWNEVARLYVIGRSPTECWIQWSNHEDSLINHGPWMKAEDKKLWSIVKQHKLCNWDHIAQGLGSRRSIAQCLIRYQRSLNAGIMRGAWTQDEDEQLRAAVQQYGDQDWLSVSATLEGRTGPQCWNRWHKILNPIRKKSGRWSVIEDKRLRLAVSVYGPRMWKVIAVHIPGRTEVQCRERWCNVLDPSLTLAEWTLEEDQILEAAVAKHGSHRWSAVASELRPRTDNQCWRRWKHLHPELLSAFQKDNKIQRAALISNFVGRERERSKLGPSDFVPEPGALGTTETSCRQDNPRNAELERASEEGLTNTTASSTPSTDVDVSLMTPELSKMRRLERLGKLREARATGKLPFWKRSTEVTSFYLEKCKRPVGQKERRYDAKGRFGSTKNGTTAFVKAVQELANICVQAPIKGKNLQSAGALSSPSSTSKRIQKDEFQTAENTSSDMAVTESAGENDEVEAAVKAVMSWPFIWGMQDLLDKTLGQS